jgi:hypothetical protein
MACLRVLPMPGKHWSWALTELAQWSARRGMPAAEIAPRIGKSKTSTYWKLKRMNVSNSHINRPKLSPATLAEMRRLWEEEPELTAAAIGELYGVTKNTVIGQAYRRGWLPRGPSASGPIARTRVDGKRVPIAKLTPVERAIVQFRWRRRVVTMPQRLDALHADLDRVLAATTGVGRVPNVPKLRRVAQGIEAAA